MALTFSGKRVLMNLNRFVRPRGEVLCCPFCMFPLTLNDHAFFSAQGRVGYDCFRCYVPNAKTINDKPFSRYSISVMEEVVVGGINCGQVIITETFVMHIQDNKWYNVHNNLLKEQTNISIVEPARKEHFYDHEKVSGLVHIGNIVWFPFIDTWNPSDQIGTLEKIKTYMLFS